MSNTINQNEIIISYEWTCPSCRYYNVGSELYNASPKSGGFLHCNECGKSFEITK